MKDIKVAVTSPSFSKSLELMGELEELGVRVHSNAQGLHFTPEALVDFFQTSGAHIAIVGLETIDERLLRACPELRFVAKYGVGLNNLDLDSMKERGIELGWSGGVNRRSVCELVLAYALGHLRNVFSSISHMRRGVWNKNGGKQLSDCTFGIVGLGHIGYDLAHLLKPFGCEILFTDILDKTAEAAALGMSAVSYETLLTRSDVISFHVPSTGSTQGMYSEHEISQTKQDALVINTSRGDIVDFDTVVKAVRQGRLGGYASDVFPVEPYNASVTADCDNLYFTPHIGGNSREAVLAMGRSAIHHVRSYLEQQSKTNEV